MRVPHRSLFLHRRSARNLLPIALSMLICACAPDDEGASPQDEGHAHHTGGGSSSQHGGSPVMQAEHDNVMALVSDAQATHRIIASGDWDDPAIWENQQKPASSGANVILGADLDVRLDTVEPVALRTLRIDGRLYLEPTVDTALQVDTVVVAPTGELEIGTEAAPIDAAHTATLTFTDSGPIDRSWDPYGFSRGLISHGTVHVHGETVTAFLPVTSAVVAGTQSLTLASIPVGWGVGDRVVLTGTNPQTSADVEERTITALSGATVTLSQPLTYAHPTPGPGYHPYLANLTRNVRFESQSAALDRRGHVMFMHSDHVEVAGAGFYKLGRTDKSIPVNDAVVSNNVLQAGTGTNVRGRYSIHVHRAGWGNPDQPVVIRGSVVDDNPGWGFVNHSSNVAFEDNVGYRAFGAVFATEAGDELGSFHHNLAVRSTGTGGQLEARKSIQDFGFEGWGFWFQGAGGLHITDNVASNHTMAGYIIYAAGLVQAGMGETMFPAQFLADASWANGASSVEVAYAPMPEFSGNEVFDTATGFFSIYLLLHAPHEQRSVVDQLRAWHIVSYGTAAYLPYTNQLTLKDSTLLATSTYRTQQGIGGTNATEDLELDNVRIEGFTQGMWVPMLGTNVVRGGVFKNYTNFNVPTGTRRTLEITDAAQLSTLPSNSATYNVATNGTLSTHPAYMPYLFDPDRILLNAGPLSGSQVYFAEQAAGFVPFVTGLAQSHVPTELLDKTNQQLWTQYGVAIYGAMTPANAGSDPSIKGMVGAPASYLPELKLLSPSQVYSSTGYLLSYKDAQGNTVTESQPLTLKSGWNVLTRVIDGQNRSFFVYNNATTPAPTPIPSPDVDPGVFELEVTDLTVSEGVGTVSVKVLRLDGSDGQVGVTWATRAETALAGSDFVNATGVLTFQDGETEKTITLTLVNDGVAEGLEQFRVVLSNPTGGATMTEEKRRVYIKIQDND